jgi:hypothetical protein
MDSGKEQNYWPGFVDALSNVVLTLVFVLVIFVFALVMASNKVAKKMNEVEAAQKSQAEVQGKLNKALAELEQLRAMEATAAIDPNKTVPDAAQLQACMRFAKSDGTQKADIDPNSSEIVIHFNASAISVTPDTTKIVHDFIENYRAKTGDLKAKFLIEAPEDPKSSSPLMARETQLGRLLNVRNSLLSGKVEAPSISIQSVTVPDDKNGYDWVKIHVQK